jgi:hypothetical protein
MRHLKAHESDEVAMSSYKEKHPNEMQVAISRYKEKNPDEVQVATVAQLSDLLHQSLGSRSGVVA